MHIETLWVIMTHCKWIALTWASLGFLYLSFDSKYLFLFFKTLREWMRLYNIEDSLSTHWTFNKIKFSSSLISPWFYTREAKFMGTTIKQSCHTRSSENRLITNVAYSINLESDIRLNSISFLVVIIRTGIIWAPVLKIHVAYIMLRHN